MSAGMAAYRLKKGRPTQKEDIVDIFNTGPDVEVATVAAQKEFYSEWFNFKKA
jgi:hypothetical protein